MRVLVLFALLLLTACGEAPAPADGSGAVAESIQAPVRVTEQVIFEGILEPDFIAWNVHGGNFAAHASLDDGRLRVNVPPGSSWGKVGILSPDPVIWLDDLGDGGEAVLTITVDPDLTTGFVIALTEYGPGQMTGSDPGNPRAAWFWRRSADGTHGTASLDRDGQAVSEIRTEPDTPAEIRFRMTPGQLSVEADGREAQTMDWPSARRWGGLRMYAYSHPPAQHQPVSFALDSIVLRTRSGAQAMLAENALPAQILFAGAPHPAWRGMSNMGRSMEEFGRFENGALRIEVPEGLGWTKPGIITTEPIIELPTYSDEAPVRITVIVDPEETTGLLVVLNRRPLDDAWREHATFDTWVRLEAGPARIGSNGNPYLQASRFAPVHWSGRYEVVLGNDWVLSGPAEGPKIRRSRAALSEGMPQFLTISLDKPREGAASKLVLEEVRIERMAPLGASDAELMAYAPDADFDPEAYLDLLALDLDATLSGPEDAP